MTDKKYTNEDIISSLKMIATTRNCNECKIRNCKWGTCNCEQITANVALDLIKRLQSENEDLFYKLTGVMHSVDKWLDGDELKQDEVNRAATMREKTLQIVENLQSENERLKKKVEELSEVLSDSIRIRYKEVQSEAYKECLTKVKNYIKTHCNPYGKPDFDYDTSIKILNFIDKLVVGE